MFSLCNKWSNKGLGFFICRVAAAVQIRPTSTYRLMQQSLHLYLIKIETRQLFSAIPLMHYTFANDMVQGIDYSGVDVGSICFIDEVYFYLDGFVNKQNWRLRGTENYHVTVPSSLNLKKSTGLGRYFFQRTQWPIFQIRSDCCTTLSWHFLWICGSTKCLKDHCKHLVLYAR